MGSGVWDTGLPYDLRTSKTSNAPASPRCRACHGLIVPRTLTRNGVSVIAFACTNTACGGNRRNRPNANVRCSCGNTRVRFHQPSGSFLCRLCEYEENKKIAKAIEGIARPPLRRCPGCGRHVATQGHSSGCQFSFSSTQVASLPGC